MPVQPDRREFLASLAAGVGLSACGKESASTSLELWYEQPAGRWVEALPVGNGRLGAMVFGGTANERIQFNEDTLWQGEPRSYANPGAHRWLDRLRSLLFEGKQAAAEELAMERFMSVPLRQKPYQSFADLLIERTGIDAAAVTGYRRSLDIENAVASVQFSADGIQHSQEVFASFPKQVLAVRLAASGTGNLSFAAGFGTSHPSQVSTEGGGGLRLSGRVEGGAIRFEARLAVQTDGAVSSDGERLRVQGASEATLLLAGATNFVNFRDVSGDPAGRNAAALAEADPVPYRALREENSDSHRQLFRRVLLDLGTSEAAAEPTDVRIERFASRPDPHLVTLLFQYGRYLLISSSRGRCQPANLQGLWNDLDQPPWDSKYTVNINTEMNYWPAESTGLPETHEPLFAALREIAVSGAETAREHYRARGWVLPISISGAARRRSTTPTTASGRPAGPGCAKTCGSTTCMAVTRSSCARPLTP